MAIVKDIPHVFFISRLFYTTISIHTHTHLPSFSYPFFFIRQSTTRLVATFFTCRLACFLFCFIDAKSCGIVLWLFFFFLSSCGYRCGKGKKKRLFFLTYLAFCAETFGLEIMGGGYRVLFGRGGFVDVLLGGKNFLGALGSCCVSYGR